MRTFRITREATAKKFRGVDAPMVAIDCVEFAAKLPLDEGLAREREAFAKLRDGDQPRTSCRGW